VDEGEPIPKGGGSYKVGQPYNINGRTYAPHENPHYRGEGIASWYGRDFHGRLTANGEVYDMHSISAAHTTMPLPSYARVTNLENGRSIVVRVNDRGPYVRNRIIDLSIGTAKALDFYGKGLARVRVEYVGRAPLEGSDDAMLLATLREGSPAPAPSKVMIASAKPFLPASSESKPALTASAMPERAPSRKMEAAIPMDPKPSSRLPLRSKSASADPRIEEGENSNETQVEPSILGLMSGRGLY
jgi:rare lipoprotein A